MRVANARSHPGLRKNQARLRLRTSRGSRLLYRIRFHVHLSGLRKFPFFSKYSSYSCTQTLLHLFNGCMMRTGWIFRSVFQKIAPKITAPMQSLGDDNSRLRERTFALNMFFIAFLMDLCNLWIYSYYAWRATFLYNFIIFPDALSDNNHSIFH